MTETNNETILLSRKRHINYGHQSFENEEFHVCVSATPTIVGNGNAQQDMLELLNDLELGARRNHRDMNLRWEIEEKDHARQEDLKESLRHRDMKKQIYDLMHETPVVTPDLIEETFDLTSREVQWYLNELEQEGKLRRRTCQRLFDVVTSEHESLEEEDT